MKEGKNMKKYVKPELFYEKFTLNTHIADCGWEMALSDKDSCVAKPDEEFYGGFTETLFTDPGRCNNTDWEGYCYQNGAEDGPFKIFMS